jgi:RimJ/RimL family protein N-acetyltransferase
VGRRHYLESFSREDLTDLYLGWLNDPEINKFLEVRRERQTPSTVLTYIEGLRQRPGCELLAIKALANDQHVGNIAITEFNGDERFATYGLLVGTIGGVRSPIAGAEATVLVIDHLLSDERIDEIRVGVNPDNDPAMALVRKLGFTVVEKDGPDGASKLVLNRGTWSELRSRYRTILNPEEEAL